MFCPSNKSFDPPPVTPSRKLPPRFGVPAAPLLCVPPGGAGELPPHAASELARTTPPAPISRLRLESGVQRPSSRSFTCQIVPPDSVICPPPALPVALSSTPTSASPRSGCSHDECTVHMRVKHSAP